MSDNPIEEWETLTVEQVADCRIFLVHRNRRRSPSSGRGGTFHTISSADWVNVLALTEEGNVVMIRQYRHGADEVTLEIPGGIIDPGESPEEAGARELLEETGYSAKKLETIGVVNPNPALFDNTAYTILATGARLVSSPSPDDLEEIAVELYSMSQINQMLMEGGITHSLVLNAFLWYSKWVQ